MKSRFEYEIFVDGKIVWKGLNPKQKYVEIKRKYPGKKVAIAWETKEDVLVC